MKKVCVFVAGLAHVFSLCAGSLFISPDLTFTMGPQGFIITAPQETNVMGDGELTRKKNNNASLVLQGLAQSCTHLGTVIAADNKKEKQQGLLNILGTVLGTAAGLSAHNNAQQVVQQQPVAVQQGEQPLTPAQPVQQQKNNQLATKLVDITTALLNEVDNEFEFGTRALPSMLSLIKEMRTQEEKEHLIASLLTSPAATRQFMDELFVTIMGYVQDVMPMVMDDIKEDFIKALGHIA